MVIICKIKSNFTCKADQKVGAKELSEATGADLAGGDQRGGRLAGRRREAGHLSAGHVREVRGALEGAVRPALPPPPPHQLQPGGSGGEEMT